METFLLGLLGAFCWGIAPIFGKIGLRNIDPVDGLAARTVVTLGFVLLWMIATGRWQRVCAISCRDWLFLGAEAFLATLAGDLAYYAALKWGSAGGTAVALSASPIFTVWASSYFLHESFTAAQLLGALLVAIGIILVASGGPA